LYLQNANEVIKLQTFYAPGTANFFDILGLDAVTEYLINFGMKMPNASSVQATGVSLQVKTRKRYFVYTFFQVGVTCLTLFLTESHQFNNYV
jgi:hypothetical protein